MASTPVTEVVVLKQRLGEIRNAIMLLDNPNSQDQGQKPTKYKFKEQSRTRYDLAMDFASVSEEFRVVEKIRADLVRNAMDEQLKELPEITELVGRWNHETSREIDKMWQEPVALRIRQIELSRLDLKENNIPFIAIGVLMNTIIIDDSQKEGVEEKADA